MTQERIATLELAPGKVKGIERDGVYILKGIPYAEAPVDEMRFRPPVPICKWDATVDATGQPSIAPQPQSRVANVTGQISGPQSEDCLTLSIYAPSQVEEPLPVLVWIHGGAHTTGGGSLEYYSGEVMARHQKIIVVCPNFRLGALGFLYLPGVSEGNLGLLDQVLALEWIRDNISSLGGNPRNVTVAGQSSGGSCVTYLARMPRAQGLVHRIIVQSAPLGRPERSVNEAGELGERFVQHLKDLDRQLDVRSAPVEAILAAQATYSKSFATPLGTTALPFMPVVDEVVVPSLYGPNGFVAPVCDVIVGFTREEMKTFHAGNSLLESVSEEDVVQSLDLSENESRTLYRHYAARRPEGRPQEILGDIHTDRTFGRPAIAYAKQATLAGRSTYLYRFDWQSPAGFKACHCLDIPFVFNNFDTWAQSPMLRGVHKESFSALASTIQSMWGSFAHCGDPNACHVAPCWPSYKLDSPYALRIGSVIDTVQAIEDR